MIDPQQDAISLTVLRQDGGLAASLTDFRLIAKLARSEVSEAVYTICSAMLNKQ